MHKHQKEQRVCLIMSHRANINVTIQSNSILLGPHSTKTLQGLQNWQGKALLRVSFFYQSIRIIAARGPQQYEM